MDRAIKPLASSADLKAHFSKKRSAKQLEDQWSLINGNFFAHRRFPFFNKSPYTYIGRTTAKLSNHGNHQPES